MRRFASPIRSDEAEAHAGGFRLKAPVHRSAVCARVGLLPFLEMGLTHWDYCSNASFSDSGLLTMISLKC